MQITAEISKISLRNHGGLSFPFNFFGVCNYSGIKAFPERCIKRLSDSNEIRTHSPLVRTTLLLKKNMSYYSGFYQGLSGYIMVFINYIALLTLLKKKCFPSIFNWLTVAWQRVLPRPKFLYEDFFPSRTLPYAITKKSKKKFLKRKSHLGS